MLGQNLSPAMSDYSESDLRTLEQMRLVRLREVAAPLKDLLLHLDLEYTLHIHCNSRAEAEALIAEGIELGQRCYLVLGCAEVAIWAEGDRLLKESVSLSLLEWKALESESTLFLEELAMATAVQSKPQAIAPVIQPNWSSNKLPGQPLSAIAADVEQDAGTVKAWLQEQGAPIIPFNGEDIVTGEAAIAAINHFTPLLINARLQKRGLGQMESGNAAAGQNGNGGATAATETVEAPAEAPAEAPTEATKAPKRMALPAKLDLVKTIRNSLVKALPKEAGLKTTYLKAIAEETEEGKRFLSRLSNAYVKKFGGESAAVSSSFLAAAKKMAG
jgi:hypothetical protein